MKKQLLQLSFAGMLFASILTGCKKDETMPASLYERLGGVVADNRINGFFAATVQSPSRTQLLRNNLIDQIGEAAGGPLKYKGKDMVTAHTGMNITDAQFNALVEDLVAALNHFMVPSTEQNELLTVLGGLKPQIVGK
jgi:hemoglobin